MATHEIIIGAPARSRTSGNVFAAWTPNPGLPVSADLLPAGTPSAYVRYFQLGSSISRSSQIFLYLGPGATGNYFGTGPDLSPTWEKAAKALRIRAGNVSLTLVGPDNSGASNRDPQEPYAWSDAGYQNYETFLRAYNALPAAQKNATVLEFDDGVAVLTPGTYARGSITAGVPALSAAVEIIPAPKKILTRGSITAGVPALSAAVEAVSPPPKIDLYCLDPDYALTSGVPPKGTVKLFLEISATFEGLTQRLPDGVQAQPLLLNAPEIRADDSFFAAAGDVAVRLDNTGGEFSGDLVGQYAQVWGLGSGKQSLMLGRVSDQTSTQTECRLTISDLPVESLQAEVPARTITSDGFPGSRDPGARIPVIFGRAVRVTCPHLTSGIHTTLFESAAAGDTKISMSKVSGIAAGDSLSLSPGRVENEEVFVRAVNPKTLLVTLSSGLSNAHSEGATVASADALEDYLLGEGAWSGGNFTAVHRLYHDRRALPEFICPETFPARTLAAGTRKFTLDAQHRVQAKNWYRGYYIEFFTADPELSAAAVIEAYDPATNKITITLAAAATDYTCYRMREYRFFNGSQAAPHPGLAFVRLARRYPSVISADVSGFASTSPSQILRECFRNSTWGAAEALQVVARNNIADYAMEGSLPPGPLADIIAEAAKFRFLRVVRERTRIALRFRADGPPLEMPAGESAYITLPAIHRQPLDRRRRAVIARYRPDAAAGETRETREVLGTVGAVKELDLPLVYAAATAARVAYQWGQRQIAGRKTIDFEAMAAGIRRLDPGDKIRLPAGLASEAASDWVVEAVRLSAETAVRIEARAYRPEELTYAAGGRAAADDADSYSPATDFSQTPPEPLRNFQARTVSRAEGTATLYECDISFTPAAENYGGAEIWFALGGGELILKTEEDPGNPGKARFDLPLNLSRYRVVGYSLSANRQLRGYPIEVKVNQSPTAAAGPDKTYAAGASVTLDGSGSSDPDGDTLIYSWRQLSGTPVTLATATAAKATFTAPRTTATHVLVFELSVSDGDTSATDSVTISVQAYKPPRPPAVPPGRPRLVRRRGPFSFAGGSFDTPGNVALKWTYTFGHPASGAAAFYEERFQITKSSLEGAKVTSWQRLSPSDVGRESSSLGHPSSTGEFADLNIVHWVEIRGVFAGGVRGPALRINAP